MLDFLLPENAFKFCSHQMLHDRTFVAHPRRALLPFNRLR